MSGYTEWEYRDTCQDSIVFPENIGPRLSIDETCLSQDEVYTIVTNKDAKGKKGSLVAMIRGTDTWSVTTALRQISAGKRSEVKEVTLDLSPAMRRIVRMSFPGAVLVNDRFHVQKLFSEAMDDLRIEQDEVCAVRIRERRHPPPAAVPFTQAASNPPEQMD